MNAIYRLLELPYGPLFLILSILAIISLIALDIYIVCLLRKRIQEGTDTSDIWFSFVCGILVEAILILNLIYPLDKLLK